jgi:predicted dehydrogenase
MAKYRSLLLGCGPRAVEHIDVYRELPNMQMVAVCDKLADRREKFKERFNVRAVFENYEKALAEVQPDIVHVVTQPVHRVWELECAARAGAKAVIVEKPLAVMPSDIKGIERLHNDYGIKIVVNCQRRYFPQFHDGTIHDIIENRIGKLYFVRASTKGNTMGMGPHTMDLLMFFLREAKPEAVWAMAYGIVEDGYQASHRAPEHILAEYWFPNGVRAIFDCDTEALGTPDEQGFWMHLHFDFLGSEGWLYLTQNKGYRYQSKGMAEPVSGESSWDKQGWQGQRAFTQAVADWLDGGKPHLNRFEVGKAVFDALIAAQQSVYAGKRLKLPPETEFTDQQWLELRERLKRIG